MHLRLPSLIATATLLVPIADAAAQVSDQPLSVVYGADALTAEGDYDFRESVYIAVPEGVEAPLYLRVFDAEVGGAHDLVYGAASDTRTRYTLLGGDGAGAPPGWPDEPGELETPASAEAILAERTVGGDANVDDRWTTLARFQPDDGDLVDGRRVFRLEVEGVDGNDGNLFGVTVSLRDRRNLPPEGLELYGFAPTVRVPDRRHLTELRFAVPPDSSALRVRNFDAARADVAVTTPTRTLAVVSSAQDEWRESEVALEPEERGGVAAVTVRGGTEIPNDVTIAVADGASRPVPIRLPAKLWTPNRRPEVVAEITRLADCRSVAFDASASRDADGDGLSFRWDFGDGGEAHGPVVVHRYAEPGSYVATVTATDNSGQVGSATALTLPVAVKRPPQADAGPDRVAAPGVPLQLDASASRSGSDAVARWLWDFNDGARGEGATPRHTFDAPGTYLVTLRVETGDDEAPCGADTDEVIVRVNAPPVAVPGLNTRVAAGDAIVFDGGASYDPDGEVVGHRWDFGDGNAAEGARVEHVFAAPGTYEVRLTVDDGSGASNATAEATSRIVVNAPPVAVAGADRALALGEVTWFDAAATRDADGDALRYRWDFGDGGTAEGRRVPYAYGEPGVFEVVLEVADTSMTATSTRSDVQRVVVNAPPVADAGVDRVVTASEVRFDGTGSHDPDGAIISYAWDFGDGRRGEGPEPVHVFREPGVYVAELTVEDNSGTVRNRATDRVRIVVNEAPIADAGPDLVGAPGQVLTFDASASIDPDGDVDLYRWDFRDGTTAEGRRVEHAFAEPGVYAVRLVVRDDTGQPAAVAAAEARVLINAPPVADAGPEILAAPGDEIVLDAAASFDPDGEITTYRWDFSDEPEPRFGAVVTRSYAAPGIRSAALTVIDDSGAQNAVAQDEVGIRINHAPVAAASSDITTASNTVRLDASASADADGDGLSYRWDFGDGSPGADGMRVTHTFAEGGTYPVVLTVDDGTGLANSRDRTAVTVTIDRPPLAVAGDNRAVCAGDIIVFDGSGSTDPEGSLLRYRWDFGDGTTADIVNPTKVYEDGGVYPVTLEVRDETGFAANRHADRIVVRVDESPAADAGPDRTVCVGSEVHFDGTGSTDPDGVVDRFSWNFGDGTVVGGDRPVHVYGEPGDYRVLLTITGSDAGQCSNVDTDEALVRVLDAPVARIAAPGLVAEGAAVRFDAGGSTSEVGPVSAFRWDFGDGTTAEGEVVEHSFAEPGRYVVSLTLEAPTEAARCNTVTARHPIVVNAAPVADAGADVVLAVDEFITFDGSGSRDPDGGIVDYHWDFGDGTEARGVNVRHRYGAGGRYAVTLTVTDDSGLANARASDNLTATVNHTPAPVIDGPIVACAEEPVTFSGEGSSDADGEVRAHLWNFGDGSGMAGGEVTHRFAAPGAYDVTLVVDDGSELKNAQAQATRRVRVNRPPIAVAGADRFVCPGDAVSFDGSASFDVDGEISAYRWEFGEGTAATGPRIDHRFGAPGVYDVVLEVEDASGSNCAVATDRLRVHVNSAPVARADGDRAGLVGGAHDLMQFEASASVDADGQPLSFRWDLGDGVSRTGEQIRHGYGAAGTYQVRLTVDDGSGLPCGVSVDGFEVTVRDRP